MLVILNKFGMTPSLKQTVYETIFHTLNFSNYNYVIINSLIYNFTYLFTFEIMFGIQTNHLYIIYLNFNLRPSN